MTHVWLGTSSACASEESGALHCWGANGSGQLGDGTTTARGTPGRVLDVAVAEDVAIGAEHACALLAGRVRCWGNGLRAQLGTGIGGSNAKPSSFVASNGKSLTSVTALEAAGDRTCALASEIFCWGGDRSEATTPPGLEGRATALAVGAHHLCAAFAEPRNAVRCVGADERGEAAGQVDVLKGAAIVSLASHAEHTCAALSDGAIRCWGRNDSGQLGDGTTRDASRPVHVDGLPPAEEIRTGRKHTCARLRNRTVACWGANDAHQLANGTTEASSLPRAVPGLVGVTELAVAGDSACVRLGDGSIRCWGANASGQLGDGTTTPHDVPMPIRSAVRPR